MENQVDKTSLSLLGRARLNDQDAWRQLVHLYGPLVERWCRQAGLDNDQTSDVFQETFQAVARKLESFKPTRSVASFRSWLKTIVRSKAIDHFRKIQKQALAIGGTAAQHRLADVADPLADDSVEQSQSDDAMVVRRAMELIQPEFDPKNWAAFEQVAMKGRKATEVAEEMGMKPQVVRQANYRIRRRLRTVLHDLVPE